MTAALALEARSFAAHDDAAENGGSGQRSPLSPRLDARYLECGTSLAGAGSFCATRCRAAFNNRRAMRGAELYDLFMALRFDRRCATRLNVFTVLSRAASLFRADDLRKRDGRRSWSEPREIIARRPYLRAQVLRGPG